MRRSAYGYIEVTPKPKPKRLTRRCRYDEFQDIIEWKKAYGNGFFSPALKRIIEQRIYVKKT